MSEDSAESNKKNEVDSVKVGQLSFADTDPGGTDEQPTSVNEKQKSKIDVLLKATGNTPIIKKNKWTVDPEKKIGAVSEFIKKYLRLEPSDSLFVYVNQAFAPSPDQTIKNLYDCFGADGKLILHYCKSQAWG